MIFQIRGEYITLDALLKALGWAATGGQARLFVADGQVTVDGRVDTRKTRKLRGGEKVTFEGKTVTVEAQAD